MPERVMCGSEVNISDPQQRTIGEILCDEAYEGGGISLPTENVRLLGEANAVPDEGDEEAVYPWGRPIIPMSLNDADLRWNLDCNLYPVPEYPDCDSPPDSRELAHGRGHFWVDKRSHSPWGPQVRAAIPMMCTSSHGAIREAPNMDDRAILPLVASSLGGGACRFTDEDFDGRSCCNETTEEECRQVENSVWVAGERCGATEHPCGNTIVRLSTLDAFVDEDLATAWGPGIRFKGYLGCDLFHRKTDPVTEMEAQVPYYIDMFGRECAYCRDMFVTFARPNVGPSYWGGNPGPMHTDPHSRRRYDSCIVDKEGNQGVWTEVMGGHDEEGGAVCKPPASGVFDYHEFCDWDSEGVPRPTHSETCVVQRLMGHIVNVILASSDILTRLRFTPSDPTVPAFEGANWAWDVCEYGCGSFGWGLAGKNEWGLPIPYDTWPILAAGEEPITSPDDLRYRILRIREGFGNCCIGGWDGVPCVETITPNLGYGPAWKNPWMSCRPICTKHLVRCDRPPSPVCSCAGTHDFAWNRNNPWQEGNRIKEAKICFKQRELCDPMNGPCDANPSQDPLSYYNPSSTTIVDVTIKVVIEITLWHWSTVSNPLCCAGISGTDGCGEGYAAGEEYARQVKVTLTGEWCGPIAWGDEFRLEAWGGYPRNPPYPGSQTRDAPGPLGATYPASFCGNLFVNQGRYDDKWDDPYNDEWAGVLSELPKRCSSWLGDGPHLKFWCPPHLTWTWKHDPLEAGGEIDQVPNQHLRRNQCWAAEPIRMTNAGCQGADIGGMGVASLAGPEKLPCTPLGCRRGCATRDDSITFNTPCEGRDGGVAGATPWGCDQCTEPAPLPSDPDDPGPRGACCFLDDIDGFWKCQMLHESECRPRLYGMWWEDQDCSEVPCPPQGACCYPQGEDWICIDTWNQAFCARVADSEWTPGRTCEEIQCGPSGLGACCIRNNDTGWYHCIGLMSEADCAENETSDWFEDKACDEIECPPPGICACCYKESEPDNYRCVEVTAEECDALPFGKCFAGTCDQLTCPSPEICEACCYFDIDLQTYQCIGPIFKYECKELKFGTCHSEPCDQIDCPPS